MKLYRGQNKTRLQTRCYRAMPGGIKALQILELNGWNSCVLLTAKVFRLSKFVCVLKLICVCAFQVNQPALCACVCLIWCWCGRRKGMWLSRINSSTYPGISHFRKRHENQLLVFSPHWLIMATVWLHAVYIFLCFQLFSLCQPTPHSVIGVADDVDYFQGYRFKTLWGLCWR